MHNNIYPSYPYQIDTLYQIIKKSQTDNQVLDYLTHSSQYIKIKYKKDKLKEHYQDAYGCYKNVLYNTEGELISFFPPKTIATEQFLLSYKNNFYGEELIDGIPFSLFWDKSMGILGSWQISGYDDIGGKNIIDHTDYSLKELFTKFNSEHVDFLNELNKKYIYHFIFPFCRDLDSNNTMIKIKLYLIDVFIVSKMNKQYFIGRLFDCPNERNMFVSNLSKRTSLSFPQHFTIQECLEKISQYETINISSNEKGIYLKTNDGIASKVLNTAFTYLHIFQSIQPKHQFLFLELKSTNKLQWASSKNKLLKTIFQTLLEYHELFLRSIYISYINIFIKKNIHLTEVHEIQQFILNKIHIFYLNTLRPQKKYCTMREVKNVFETFSIEEQMFFLTYPLRDV